MIINFIQISDLHHHFSNFDSEKMRLSLLKYIQKLTEETKFNFMAFTGDISHQGKAFGKPVVQYLDSLLASSKLDRDSAYIIPGNHDLKRNDARALTISGIMSENEPSNELDYKIKNKDVKKLLLESYKPYFSFYKSFLGGDYPKKDLHYIIQTPHYNIIHINTCLVASKSREEGTLLLGKQLLLSCLEKLPKDEKKLNIAIGHHTPECLSRVDERVLLTNFEDYGIDIYLSGHVHNPGYNRFNNYSGILGVVSGAGLIDSYANGGFVTGSINTQTGDAYITFHAWYKDGYYWAPNNGVDRGAAKDGTLYHSIDRIKKNNEILIKKNIVNQDDEQEMSTIEIDEDEFKQFIIDFHNHPREKKKLSKDKMKKKKIEEKFDKMKCSETFELLFLKYAEYFSAIEEILNSTAYVESEKKEIVSELIIEKYMDIHNHYSNGDEIFNNLVKEIMKEYPKFEPYSTNHFRRFIRILVSWCIYDCGIFNDQKHIVI